MIAICWGIVLLEDEHFPSNATGHWQQFLHQQHVSLMLSVDFSLSYNENKVEVKEFRYYDRDLIESQKVERVRRRLLALTSRCLVIRSFCEFLGERQLRMLSSR